MATEKRRIMADYKTEVVQTPTPTGLVLSNAPQVDDIVETPGGHFWVVSAQNGTLLGLPLQVMPYEVMSAAEKLEERQPLRIAGPPESDSE